MSFVKQSPLIAKKTQQANKQQINLNPCAFSIIVWILLCVIRSLNLISVGLHSFRLGKALGFGLWFWRQLLKQRCLKDTSEAFNLFYFRPSSGWTSWIMKSEMTSEKIHAAFTCSTCCLVSPFIKCSRQMTCQETHIIIMYIETMSGKSLVWTFGCWKVTINLGVASNLLRILHIVAFAPNLRKTNWSSRPQSSSINQNNFSN